MTDSISMQTITEEIFVSIEEGDVTLELVTEAQLYNDEDTGWSVEDYIITQACLYVEGDLIYTADGGDVTDAVLTDISPGTLKSCTNLAHASFCAGYVPEDDYDHDALRQTYAERALQWGGVDR